MNQAQTVTYAVENGVALIAVNNPPVNALAAGVREGIMEGVARANADAGVDAIVLLAKARRFPSLAPISAGSAVCSPSRPARVPRRAGSE
ncbi:hypothetical protein ACTMU2_16590 [Cupriavidus basilensis]